VGSTGTYPATKARQPKRDSFWREPRKIPRKYVCQFCCAPCDILPLELLLVHRPHEQPEDLPDLPAGPGPALPVDLLPSDEDLVRADDATRHLLRHCFFVGLHTYVSTYLVWRQDQKKGVIPEEQPTNNDHVV